MAGAAITDEKTANHVTLEPASTQRTFASAFSCHWQQLKGTLGIGSGRSRRDGKKRGLLIAGIIIAIVLLALILGLSIGLTRGKGGPKSLPLGPLFIQFPFKHIFRLARI